MKNIQAYGLLLYIRESNSCSYLIKTGLLACFIINTPSHRLFATVALCIKNILLICKRGIISIFRCSNETYSCASAHD